MASDWHFVGVVPDRDRVERSGTSVEVARRGADGRWRFIIDEAAFLGWPLAIFPTWV